MLKIIKPYIVLMRPKQWVKNLFIFAAPFFSLNLFVFDNVIKLMLGFISWCLISSSIYAFNDIVDRERDKYHLVKHNRPVASGKITIGSALGLSLCLLALSMCLALKLGGQFAAAIGLYLVVNIFYTFYLKHVFILDVMCIAFGFVLRVISGAFLMRVGFSEWIIMCTLLLSLLLGFGKRKEEFEVLEDDAGKHRKSLEEYDRNFLQHIPYVLISSIIVCYMLYTVSSEAVRKFGTKNLIYTTPFVMYGLFRYVYVAYERKKGADPTQVLFQDWPTVVNIFVWLLTTGFIMYLERR